MNSFPVIIAGMHRSGTSWTTSLLEDAGFNVGSNCLSADRNNQKGYFEDLDFLALNRKMLHSSLTPGEKSYIDWGWSSSECLDINKLVKFEAEALKLLDSRKTINSLWGWKDPRNSVLLNFWDKLCPQARYILIYRYPWEVADSMQRLGSEVFLNNPDYALSIWELYNRHLLEFYHKNKQRCLLLSSNALSKQHKELSRLLSLKFGFSNQAITFSNKFEPALFKSIFDPKIAKEIYTIAFPEVIKLLNEMDSVADLGNPMMQTTNSNLRFNRSWENNNSKPRISVIIPCYNQGIYLADALSSVECFAPTETEVLITNDGSTDNSTSDILNRLATAGYTVLSQLNAGLAKTRNRMVEKAKADIILPLDADNRICENFIDKALEKFFADPDISIVYGNRIDFGLRNENIELPDFNLSQLLNINYIDACAVIKKKVIVDCGGYDSGIAALEDWELWINAAARGYKFYRLPFSTFEYRVKPLSMISILKVPEKNKEIISYIQIKHSKLYLDWLKERVSELQSVNQRFKNLLNEQQILLSEQQSELHKLKAKIREMISDKDIISSKDHEIARLNQIQSKIMSSYSWQITAPLRTIAGMIRSKLPKLKDR